MKFKKEIILLISIIIGIGILEITITYFSQESVNTISNKIDYVKNNLYKIAEMKKNNNLNDNTKEQLIKEVEDLKKYWYEEEKKLSMFAEHDELEKVTKAIVVLEENTKNEEYEIALENASEFKYWLNHFAEKERLNLKNIL